MTGQTGRTGQTAAVAGQTGRLVVGLLLLVLPPECFCGLRGLLCQLLFRPFITNDYIFIFLLLIWLDLAKLAL